MMEVMPDTDLITRFLMISDLDIWNVKSSGSKT